MHPTVGERLSAPFIPLTGLLQLKPVLLIMFDISLISFIYIPSAPTRRLLHTSFYQERDAYRIITTTDDFV